MCIYIIVFLSWGQRNWRLWFQPCALQNKFIYIYVWTQTFNDRSWKTRQKLTCWNGLFFHICLSQHVSGLRLAFARCSVQNYLRKRSQTGLFHIYLHTSHSKHEHLLVSKNRFHGDSQAFAHGTFTKSSANCSGKCGYHSWMYLTFFKLLHGRLLVAGQICSGVCPEPARPSENLQVSSPNILEVHASTDAGPLPPALNAPSSCLPKQCHQPRETSQH